MGKTLVFDWMLINDVLAHIEIDLETKEVKCDEYDDRFIYQFLAKRPRTIKSVLQKLKERCFEENRPDRDELLQAMNLRQYSVLDMVRINHGHTNRDDMWVRFDYEPDLLYYRDINGGVRPINQKEYDKELKTYK